VAVSRSLRHVRSHTIDLIDTIIHQVQENLDESPYSCLLAFAGAPSRRHGKGKGSLGGAIWRGHQEESQMAIRGGLFLPDS